MVPPNAASNEAASGSRIVVTVSPSVVGSGEAWRRHPRWAVPWRHVRAVTRGHTVDRRPDQPLVTAGGQRPGPGPLSPQPDLLEGEVPAPLLPGPPPPRPGPGRAG